MSNPTLMLPSTLMAMNCGANAASRTYRKYQLRKNAVIGKMKPRSFLRRVPNSALCWAVVQGSIGDGASAPPKRSVVLMQTPPGQSLMTILLLCDEGKVTLVADRAQNVGPIGAATGDADRYAAAAGWLPSLSGRCPDPRPTLAGPVHATAAGCGLRRSGPDPSSGGSPLPWSGTPAAR